MKAERVKAPYGVIYGKRYADEGPVIILEKGLKEKSRNRKKRLYKRILRY